MSRDEAYVLDMLTAARDAMAFCTGCTRERFAADRMVQFAVVRAIEIVGEAARNVTEATRAAHPGIPWRDIVATRHRIAHDYSHVDWAIIWEVVERDLPGLVVALQAITCESA